MNKTKIVLLSVLGVGLLFGAFIGFARPYHTCQNIDCNRNSCLILDRGESCCPDKSVGAVPKCQNLDCVILRCPCQR